MERIPPPESIARRLNLDPRTDTVVVRRHVRYIDGKPAIISDDYFDERIIEGTELAQPEDTTRENILSEAGYEQVYDIDEIITACPHPPRLPGLAYRLERQSPSTSGPATPLLTGQSASWCPSFRVTP